MAHDFEKFPELTNSQMALYYFDSPHQQILEDFDAKVIKVHDGDTITLRTEFRDFDFPLRFLNTDAPELKEGGEESRTWLTRRLLNKKVEILMDAKQRVGKFGRLLGTVMEGGFNVNDESIMAGMAQDFGKRKDGAIPDVNKELTTTW